MDKGIDYEELTRYTKLNGKAGKLKIMIFVTMILVSLTFYNKLVSNVLMFFLFIFFLNRFKNLWQAILKTF